MRTRRTWVGVSIVLGVFAASCTVSPPPPAPCDFQPDPSLDGVIALTERVGNGTEQVITFDPATGVKSQLTTQGQNVLPQYTVDGQTIYFSSNRPAGDTRIWRMNHDGTGQTQVSSHPGTHFQPRPSPDGSLVAFVGVDPAVGVQEIWTMNSDGTNPQQLTSTAPLPQPPFGSYFPQFNPDGTKILYSSSSSGETQLWVMDVDGSNQHPITNGSFGVDFPEANAPDWSPDGQRITSWSGFETFHGEIWTFDPDGSNPIQLTDEPGIANSDNPSWSPDGQHVVFATGRSGGTPQMWLMNADGSDERCLLNLTPTGHQFSWRPT